MDLTLVSNEKCSDIVQPLLIENEGVTSSFEGISNYVIFTNKRIISISKEGLRAKDKTCVFIPYKSIKTFSISTGSIFSPNYELKLYVDSAKEINFKFSNDTNIVKLERIISTYILG